MCRWHHLSSRRAHTRAKTKARTLLLVHLAHADLPRKQFELTNGDTRDSPLWGFNCGGGFITESRRREGSGRRCQRDSVSSDVASGSPTLLAHP